MPSGSCLTHLLSPILGNPAQLSADRTSAGAALGSWGSRSVRLVADRIYEAPSTDRKG
jgi:hypothetical protein